MGSRALTTHTPGAAEPFTALQRPDSDEDDRTSMSDSASQSIDDGDDKVSDGQVSIDLSDEDDSEREKAFKERLEAERKEQEQKEYEEH